MAIWRHEIYSRIPYTGRCSPLNIILLRCKSLDVICNMIQQSGSRPTGSARWSTIMIVRIAVTVRNYPLVIDTRLTSLDASGVKP